MSGELVDECAPLLHAERAADAIVREIDAGVEVDQVRVVRMGLPDRLVTHGDPKLLLAKYGLDSDGIYTRVKESIEVLEDRRAKRRKVTT